MFRQINFAMISRQQISQLKQEMDLSYLDNFDPAIQEIAFKIYFEIRNLLTTSDAEISESLTNCLGTTLEQYNNVLIQNNQFREELRTMKNVLRKCDQGKTEYKKQFEAQKKLYEDLQKEIEEDDIKAKNENSAMKSQKEEIVQLKAAMKDQETKHRESNRESNEIMREQRDVIEKLKTSLETMEAAWKVDQENIQKLKKQIEEDTPPEMNDTNLTFRTTHSINDTTLDQEMQEIQEESTFTNTQTSSTAVAQQIIENREAQSHENAAPKTREEPKKLLVIGDSHTRDFKSILSNLAPKNCKISCIVRPGKTVGQIVDEIDSNKLGPQTHIVFFAGTNDVFHTTWESMKASLDKLHEKTKNNKILMILIPHRYDTKKINFHIKKLNFLIKMHLKPFSNFEFLEPGKFMKPLHYAYDGVHMNRKGKQKLSDRIINSIFSLSTTTRQPNEHTYANNRQTTTTTTRTSNKHTHNTKTEVKRRHYQPRVFTRHQVNTNRYNHAPKISHTPALHNMYPSAPLKFSYPQHLAQDSYINGIHHLNSNYQHANSNPNGYIQSQVYHGQNYSHPMCAPNNPASYQMPFYGSQNPNFNLTPTPKANFSYRDALLSQYCSGQHSTNFGGYPLSYPQSRNFQ